VLSANNCINIAGSYEIVLSNQSEAAIAIFSLTLLCRLHLF